MRRCGGLSSPLAAVSLLLLLICFFHRAAAARPLPAAAAVPLQVHQDDEPVLQKGAAAGSGHELSVSSVAEVMVGAEEEAEDPACEEGNDRDDCMQRRLLGDAHLDYIYTQHKGKP
ncbi:phytosulfokines 5-like isoform X2 [Panicum virgatum]|uniref:phytosulfokines 5-like isoform X2 n=1 Tax=Panicum virgatum TaxID=38727 RepID=UPI0019D5E1EC|nr:phytosulfokines 5-like isoform X2 [Panicum virgatum]